MGVHDETIGAMLGTFLAVHDDVLPGFVEGCYVVGSAALDDWIPGHSDLDVVVVTTEVATDEDARSLLTARALLDAELDGQIIDGPYVAWTDLATAPTTGLHRPYVEHGEFRHDGECFEINPVTWHVLATAGRTARGAAPSKLGIHDDPEDLLRFVVANMAAYWAPLARQIRDHLGLMAAHTADEPAAAFDGASLEWCALGALRLHHTAFTGNVISKRAAGEYGLSVAPVEFQQVLREALALRANPAKNVPVAATSMLAAADMVTWAAGEVADAAAARRF